MKAKHVIHLENSHTKVLIRTVDTDVMVLAIRALQLAPINSEIWVIFRAGKTSRSLSAHSFSNTLGRDKSLALSVFHALEGCDTISFCGLSFCGDGGGGADGQKNAFTMYQLTCF